MQRKGQVDHTGAEPAPTKRRTNTRWQRKGWDEKQRNHWMETRKRCRETCRDARGKDQKKWTCKTQVIVNKDAHLLANEVGERKVEPDAYPRTRGICPTPRLTERALPSPSIPCRTCTPPRTKQTSRRRRRSVALPSTATAPSNPVFACRHRRARNSRAKPSCSLKRRNRDGPLRPTTAKNAMLRPHRP